MAGQKPEAEKCGSSTIRAPLSSACAKVLSALNMEKRQRRAEHVVGLMPKMRPE